jgi:large subunit ribosomal protein L32e
MHNKMRRYFSGKRHSPAIGYGSREKVRGLHPSGYEEVLVSSPSELEKIDKETQAVRVSGRVGKRKKQVILEKAEEMELKVLNPTSFEIETLEEEMEEEEE